MFPTRLAARLPLQLSPDQCDAYTEVAYGVRDQAIELYEAYLARTTDPQAPAFDPQEWKLLKQKFDPHDWKLFRQKEQFQILVSRQKQQPTVYRAPGMYQSDVHKHIHESAEWHPQSALRTVGSFACSVEDALYGSAVPTEKVMMVKSLAVHDHFIDHKSLCDITIPTDDEPFTHVGLKWSARPPYLATMVRPRDTTFVHAAGFCTVNFKGQQSRAGFHVYHSIENIPGVPEFTELSFRRFRFSLCIIYLPGDAGVLNVFASMASDAGGDLPRRLTTMFTATALASIYNAADNALRKKLAALRSDTAKADMRIPSMASTLGETPTGDCPLCSRRPSVLHPLKRCGVCRKSVCSRCVTTRTLVLGHTKASLRPTNVAICSGCLTIASNLDVRELAIQEFVRPFDPDYVESLPSTQSISTDVSGSFFGDRHNSTAFLSIAGSDSESDRYSDDQPSMWGPASLSR